MSQELTPIQQLDKKTQDVLDSIKGIQIEIERRLEVNEDLDVESLKFTKIFSFFSRLWEEVEIELKTAEQELRLVSMHLTRHYSGVMSSEHYKKNPLTFSVPKAEVQNYVKVDPLFLSTERYFNAVAVKANLIEDAKKAVKERSYAIKNAIDYQKFVQEGR